MNQMIRGGMRVTLQNTNWSKNVKNAVRMVLAKQPTGEVGTPLFRSLSSTVDDDVLGKYTALTQHDVMGRCLVATEDIPKNTIVLPVDGMVMDEPNTWTIQVSADHHLLSVGGSQLVAHSCSPNVFLLFDETNSRQYPGSDAVLPSLYFCTKQDIAKGELLSFDYNSSEWQISDTFNDSTTDANISGFKFVSDPVYRLRLLPYLTPPIVRLGNENNCFLPEEQAIAGVLCKTL